MYIDIVTVVLCRSPVQGGGCVDGCRSLFLYVSNQVTGGNVVVGGYSGRLCKMESRESVVFSNFLHSFYVCIKSRVCPHGFAFVLTGVCTHMLLASMFFYINDYVFHSIYLIHAFYQNYLTNYVIHQFDSSYHQPYFYQNYLTISESHQPTPLRESPTNTTRITTTIKQESPINTRNQLYYSSTPQIISTIQQR